MSPRVLQALPVDQLEQRDGAPRSVPGLWNWKITIVAEQGCWKRSCYCPAPLCGIVRATMSTRSAAMARETPIVAENEITIFGRLIEPGHDGPPPKVAQYILALDFRFEQQTRMHTLAMKAQKGTLTLKEKGEIDSYERVGHMLSLWKSKARKALGMGDHGNRRVVLDSSVDV